MNVLTSLGYGNPFTARNRNLDGSLKTCGRPVIVKRGYLSNMSQQFCCYDAANFGFIQYEPKNLRSSVNYFDVQPMNTYFVDCPPKPKVYLTWSQDLADKITYSDSLDHSTYLNRFEYPNDDYIVLE